MKIQVFLRFPVALWSPVAVCLRGSDVHKAPVVLPGIANELQAQRSSIRWGPCGHSGVATLSTFEKTHAALFRGYRTGTGQEKFFWFQKEATQFKPSRFGKLIGTRLGLKFCQYSQARAQYGPEGFELVLGSDFSSSAEKWSPSIHFIVFRRGDIDFLVG